jgi:hypothetical protein
MELLGLVDLIISSWKCQGFSTAEFGKGLNDTKSGLFTNMVRLITWAQSISSMFGYVIENTLFQLNQREKVRALHAGQALPWRAPPIRCSTMRFLCAPATQLVDQLGTTFNYAVGSKIYHQKSKLAGFSHIG